MAKVLQKAYKFDKISLVKMAKGLGLAMLGPALIGGLQFLEAIVISDPNIAMLYAAALSVIANIFKEFVAGK